MRSRKKKRADARNKKRARIRLGVEIRRLQQQCKMSNLQAKLVAELLEKYGYIKGDLCGADREMRDESGVELIKLEGCVHENDDGEVCQHIYGPGDKRTCCPKCGTSRYREDGRTPNEVVYYFPLRPRLEALLKLPSFLKLLQVIIIYLS